MKIALLGKGKTGSKVIDFASKNSGITLTVFDSKTPITCESLEGHNIVISFIPGDAFKKLIPCLIECNLPVVTGSTGFEWPNDINEKLKEEKLKWIYAHNFSLGINIVKEMIETLAKAKDLFTSSSYSIHETHHTDKKDAPSGTAISFDQWLGYGIDAKITSERTGDVIGEHELSFECEDEKITLKHEAKDRSIFARGAIWAADILLEDETIPTGLNTFHNVVMNKLTERK